MADKLVSLLEDLKEKEPAAADTIQGLIDVTQNLKAAAGDDDLETATEQLKKGAKLVEKLLTELTDNKFIDVYSKVETDNEEVDEKLDSGDGSFDDVNKFLKSIVDNLGEALSE